jgi:hypothetical protein
VTPEESKAYNADRLAAYHAMFGTLTEDEKNDPEARRRCVQPLMEWHHEKTMQVVDHRKAEGKSKALLNKAASPLIHQVRSDTRSSSPSDLRVLQSTAISNNLDIEIFGLAIDCFGDDGILWGGGALFQKVFEQHPAPIRKFLVDMKALFQ